MVDRPSPCGRIDRARRRAGVATAPKVRTILFELQVRGAILAAPARPMARICGIALLFAPLFPNNPLRSVTRLPATSQTWYTRAQHPGERSNKGGIR